MSVSIRSEKFIDYKVFKTKFSNFIKDKIPNGTLLKSKKRFISKTVDKLLFETFDVDTILMIVNIVPDDDDDDTTLFCIFNNKIFEINSFVFLQEVINLGIENSEPSEIFITYFERL